MSEHQSLLKKALFVLSSRIKLSSKSQPGFQELLKYAINCCVVSQMTLAGYKWVLSACFDSKKKLYGLINSCDRVAYHPGPGCSKLD